MDQQNFNETKLLNGAKGKRNPNAASLTFAINDIIFTSFDAMFPIIPSWTL
jgi:hypothetical protein